MANHRRHGTDLPKNSPPTSTANGCVKKTSEAKKEQSESSDEEEFDASKFFLGTVQADFAFFDPKPDDFHGVKPFLQTYLDDRKRHSPPVGTVVKIEADEDNGVFTLATALNLERYKKDVKDDLGSHLGKEEKSVGHLVSQRLTNLPLQLLPPLYDAVFDEVSWDTEDDPTAELRNFSRLYLFILFLMQNYGNNIIKPEDDIFHKLSSWSFEFPLHTEQPTLEASSSIGNLFLRNYQQMGLVMDVKAGQIPTFRQQLKSVVDESRF
ncbi:BCCIP-like protein [Pyrus ussuriensis x Pyrus communis]|uniref:BCCIP-like protein n=1 Tax=Pyrus ussuriensis x Pyrus communis TaxID=2448454 RepID=A0A5N5H9A7_9ROSA|nr:BCCIP-like protein [Pyrus ussuriensis x Pyrus communis]